MAWIYYKKAYNSVPHLWKLECLRLYKIDPRLVTFIRQSMSHWRTILSANSKSIANVTINIDIDKSYKYLKILQLFGNNDEEVRCKANSEYRNPVRLVLMSKFFSKNKVTEIDTFSIPVIRYSAAVVSWRRRKLERNRLRSKEAHDHALCSIPSQAQLDYTPAERREKKVCIASKMLCAKKSRASSPNSAGKQIVTH